MKTIKNDNRKSGVYIFHETLGVCDVHGWNPKDNDGVVGILLVDNDYQIVIATEDSPQNLQWSKELILINQPIEESEDAESDFNGECYCKNLNSPDFPAAYYCLNYKKGGRNWYLPSSGELLMICNHLDKIQNALSVVGGQKFVTEYEDDVPPIYWVSTEHSATYAWYFAFTNANPLLWYCRATISHRVRPVSKLKI